MLGVDANLPPNTRRGGLASSMPASWGVLSPLRLLQEKQQAPDSPSRLSMSAPRQDVVECQVAGGYSGAAVQAGVAVAQQDTPSARPIGSAAARR